jgi:hypothetical protein
VSYVSCRKKHAHADKAPSESWDGGEDRADVVGAFKSGLVQNLAQGSTRRASDARKKGARKEAVLL